VEPGTVQGLCLTTETASPCLLQQGGGTTKQKIPASRTSSTNLTLKDPLQSFFVFHGMKGRLPPESLLPLSHHGVNPVRRASLCC